MHRTSLIHAGGDGDVTNHRLQHPKKTTILDIWVANVGDVIRGVILVPILYCCSVRSLFQLSF